METKTTTRTRNIFLAIAMLFTFGAFGQGIIPTVGTDFWMGFMNNYGGGNAELRLFISGETATTGTVDMPLQAWNQNFTVTPGVVTTVVVPLALGEHTSTDIVDTKGIHITTADSVSVFGINFANATADATKVLPIKSLGTEYLVSTYQGIGFAGNNFASVALVVATEDGTEIEITPSVGTQGGNAAGVPYTVQLDQGESYQIHAFDNNSSLSGTRIVGTAASGDCRPFAVFGGVECANIPTGCTYCDHVCDQMLPSTNWGTDYYTVPFSGPTSYTYTVIARDNGTSVSINNGPPFILNSGQTQIFNNVTTADKVSGSAPISVTQFAQGTSCSGTGDPAMLVLNADDQKISNVTFATVTSGIINSHDINVVVETADIGTVLLDGIPIPAASFAPYPANPVNSYAQVGLTAGSHTLSAPNGFSGYCYGTGNAESYAYSVGSFSPEPPLPVDSALCTSDTVILSPPSALFNPEWTTMSDTSTVIGTSNTLVLVPPIVNDIYIISGSSLVSGCTQEYLYSVAVPNPPVIAASASDDTVCMFNNVNMDVAVQTPGLFDFSWAPAYYFDNPNTQSPTYTAMQSGWVYVTVSSVGSTCSMSTDSLYIVVQGGGIGSVTTSAVSPSICLGDSTQLDFQVSQVVYFDDFNGGIDPNLWSSAVGYSTSNACGALSGDAMFFDGPPANRYAETVDMNTTLGGTLEFSIKVANGVAPCEDADLGEDVLLQYSNTGGAPWTTIQTLFEYAYPAMTAVSVPIPAGAQTAATRFRWVQPTFSAAAEDVWLLENVSIQLNDNTGFSYAWTPASTLDNDTIQQPMATPTADTWYVLTVGQGNCTYSDSVLVSTNDFMVDAGQDSILCTTNGFQLNVVTDAVGPTYTWNNAAYLDDNSIANPTINMDTTLTYVVTVDNGTCAKNDTVTITHVTSANVAIPNDTTVCEGQSFQLDLGMSSNITWNPITNILNPTSTTPTFSPTADQMYYVDYQTPEGCYISDSIQVYVTLLPIVTLGNDTTVCTGSPVIMNSTVNVPAPDYLWSTNDTIANITATSAGTYWLTITTGCGTSTDSLIITDFTNFTNNLGPDTSLCPNEQLVLTPTIPAGGTILWTGGLATPTYTVTTASTVWAELTDSNNCVMYDTINVAYHAQTIVDLGPDITICEYDTVTLDATVPTGDTYLWSPNGETTETIDIWDPGMFTVDIIDVNGCPAEDSINVTEILAPVPTIVGPPQYCDSEEATYGLTQAYNSYLWYGGSDSTTTTISGPHTEIYVMVTGANNCIGYDTMAVEMVPTPTVDLPDEILLCDTALVQVTAYMANATYLWDTGDTTASIIVGEGTYAVEAFAVCAAYDTVEVVVGKVDFTLGPDQRICDGDVIFLAPQINNFDSLIWYDGTQANIFSYTDHFYPGDSIEISGMAYGCGDTGDTIIFYVEDCNCPIFVPNSFTPNDDEYNNDFRIGQDCLLEEFEFIIYNRWGEQVFIAYDPDFVWDGTNKFGQYVQDGTYVWRMRYKYAYNIEQTDVEERTGHINVLK